jgi:iron complex outermembrane recepter protein
MRSRDWYLVVLGLLCGVSQAQSLDIRKIDIPAQPLSSALRDFVQQTGLQLAVETSLTAGKKSPGVKGEIPADKALDQLLVGSGLKYEFLDSKTVAVSRIEQTSVAEKAAFSPTAIRLVQSDGPAPASKDEEGATVEEVVVTGTHIRGGQSASPLLVFDREDIERSGFATTQQFVQALPQNFTGGQSETTFGAILGGRGSAYNVSNATGVNLRGLGNGSTLTLLNGHRLAPVNIGQTVDLAAIPLGAIERIDVLTDGASAIYGSDAIGGVVNIVLNRDFAGMETRLRYDDVAHSSSHEWSAQQTLGTMWDSGNLLLTAEFSERTRLGSQERSFTRSDSFADFNLLPPRERRSGLLSLSQTLSPHINAFVDAFYSAIDTEDNQFSFSNILEADQSSAQHNIAAGIQIGLPGTWQVRTEFTHGKSETERTVVFPAIGYSEQTNFVSAVSAADAKLDGSVFALPGGDVKMAFGAQYRRETFNSNGQVLSTGGTDRRNVGSIFTEVYLPLIGAGNSGGAAQRLELTLALRHEDYSDFGTSTNPKFGVSWSPISALNLRATYGTSFRAPLMYERSEAAEAPFGYLASVADPAVSDGDSVLFIVYGNNAALQPEEATFWTAGMDLKFESLPGLTLATTYFDIDYQDRIQIPLVSDLFASLLEADIYVSRITRNPSAELRNRWPVGFNFDPDNLSIDDVEVLFDNRLSNIATTRESGLDFTADYSFDAALGHFTLQLNSTYLLDKRSQVTASAPFSDELNRDAFPVDLKARGGVSWSRERLGASLFVNYVDDYTNSALGFQGESIDSFTTLDLTIRYRAPQGVGLLSEATASLSVVNLLDESPPFVGNVFSLNFDPTNSSASGRILGLTVSKGW